MSHYMVVDELALITGGVDPNGGNAELASTL